MVSFDVKPLLDRIRKLDSGELSFGDLNFVALTNIYVYCSYAYYVLDEVLMSDMMFDLLCAWLYQNFDILEITGVWHVGKLILKENLHAGTCLVDEYPKMFRDIATEMVEIVRAERVERGMTY